MKGKNTKGNKQHKLLTIHSKQVGLYTHHKHVMIVTLKLKTQEQVTNKSFKC